MPNSPLLGTVLGTYEDALRPLQTHVINLTIYHADNDYLEFASKTGLVGASLLFLPIFYLLSRMIAAFLKDHRGFRSSILLGCVGRTLGY